MRLVRSDRRPYHLGPFPLEVLRRAAAAPGESERPAVAAAADPTPSGELAGALRTYRELFARFAVQDPAATRAPLPESAERRMIDIKGAAYFLNVSQVGIGPIPRSAWLEGAEPEPHGTAVVLLLEHARVPEDEPLAARWIEPAVAAAADTRLAEIAVVIAGYIRQLGHAARADVAGHRKLDAERLAVLAGLAVRRVTGIANPYVAAFSLAVVSTDYALPHDRPLAPAALRARGLRYWWGINGARSGRERNRRAARPSHASAYPMEALRRVDRPTTLIRDQEVPRVPKRAAFFERALRGDLGERAQRERTRFATKHPLAQAMTAAIRGMVPLQDGVVGAAANPAEFADPERNARAVKSLAYFLGADLAGICEVPRYAWYSHREDGAPVTPYHRYAVVMLIDQEFDTMEGASGDDWISGAQSMRAYLRGAAIAGTMAETLRRLGFAARAQTNADSDVLHIPLILWAGLGELSRIGELVLNPFVGPRFKSVVLTTDLPLAVDRPIDFGLQYFCSHCLKCARECPCDAIPFGDKVVFNGYETWKPDVERCTRYRLTNPHGSACGRCMKTCPLNKVVDADGPLLARLASWLGIHAPWAKPLLVPVATRFDDWIGNGRRNPAKQWWLDLEIVNGVAVAPRGVNRRDIDPARRIDRARQTIAVFPAPLMPPPDAHGAVPLDRKAGLAAAARLETPAAARARPLFSRSAPPTR